VRNGYLAFVDGGLLYLPPPVPSSGAHVTVCVATVMGKVFISFIGSELQSVMCVFVIRSCVYGMYMYAAMM